MRATLLGSGVVSSRVFHGPVEVSDARSRRQRSGGRMNRLLLFVATIGWVSVASACGSTAEVRCKPSDNEIAMCQVGSHEECEDLPSGCQRCTCEPDRPESL